MNETIEKMVEKGLNEREAAFIADVADWSVKVLARQGELPIHAFLRHDADDENDENRLSIVAFSELAPWNKDLSMELVRCMAYITESKSVAITSESWTLPKGLTPEQIEEYREKYSSIEEMPGHGEGLVIGLNSESGRAFILYEVKRDEKGMISEIALDQVNVEEGGNKITGRMIETRYTAQDMLRADFTERVNIGKFFLSQIGSQFEIPQGSNEGNGLNTKH